MTVNFSFLFDRSDRIECKLAVRAGITSAEGAQGGAGEERVFLLDARHRFGPARQRFPCAPKIDCASSPAPEHPDAAPLRCLSPHGRSLMDMLARFVGRDGSRNGFVLFEGRREETGVMRSASSLNSMERLGDESSLQTHASPPPNKHNNTVHPGPRAARTDVGRRLAPAGEREQTKEKRASEREGGEDEPLFSLRVGFLSALSRSRRQPPPSRV